LVAASSLPFTVTLYTLDGFDKVKALMGDKVTVKGKLDAATKTITVESASKASE